LCYVNEFQTSCIGKTTITSSKFRTVNYPNDDSFMENTEDGAIRIYTIDSATASKKILVENAGTVDFTNGKVNINSIQFVSGSNEDNEIFISATPLNDDVSAVREVYLNLSIEDSILQVFQETA
jgi:hypothetical protein